MNQKSGLGNRLPLARFLSVTRGDHTVVEHNRPVVKTSEHNWRLFRQGAHTDPLHMDLTGSRVSIAVLTFCHAISVRQFPLISSGVSLLPNRIIAD